MSELIEKGSWVEIHDIVLEAGERAPQVPEDTRRVPLEMRVKGFLSAPTAIGEDADIETLSGRHLRGKLTAVNPAYTHSFGAPLPELTSIGCEVRALLRANPHISPGGVKGQAR
jgi:hypothetical protein